MELKTTFSKTTSEWLRSNMKTCDPSVLSGFTISAPPLIVPLTKVNLYSPTLGTLAAYLFNFVFPKTKALWLYLLAAVPS